MVMEPGEIARLYRTSANPAKQINLLCQLNECTRDEIVTILIRQGMDIAISEKPKKIRVPKEAVKILEKRMDKLDSQIAVIENLLRQYEEDYLKAAELFKRMEVIYDE